MKNGESSDIETETANVRRDTARVNAGSTKVDLDTVQVSVDPADVKPESRDIGTNSKHGCALHNFSRASAAVVKSSTSSEAGTSNAFATQRLKPMSREKSVGSDNSQRSCPNVRDGDSNPLPASSRAMFCSASRLLRSSPGGIVDGALDVDN